MNTAPLRGVRRLAVDTAPIIYLIEDHPKFGTPARALLQWAADTGVPLLCSALTLTEVLVQPLRLGRQDLVDRYRAALTGDPGVSLVAIDANVAALAADLRARHHLRTPDAVQLAAAIEGGADAFLTNDGDLSRVLDIRVIQLGELAGT